MIQGHKIRVNLTVKTQIKIKHANKSKNYINKLFYHLINLVKYLVHLLHTKLIKKTGKINNKDLKPLFMLSNKDVNLQHA